MSNKKQTAVEWLVQRIIDRLNQKDNPNFRHLFTLDQIFEHAKEMESKKQQKYDEMLGMLEERFEYLDSLELDIYSQEFIEYCKLKQLIKEAKEL
jgi:hypothetical protein